MAILDLIDEKMKVIKPVSEQEIEQMRKWLMIVKEAINALNNEDLLIDYDFSIAINLINQNVTNFGIVDLKKGIQDKKNVLIAKKKYNIELPEYEEQQRVVNVFREKLFSYKRELETLINKYSNQKVNEELLENLEDLKNLIEGKGRRKNYTFGMLESLFEVVDYETLTYKDALELTDVLNTKDKEEDNEIDKNDVINLLKEYLGDKIKIGFIERHQQEICSLIDLDNAKKILEFFKEEDILKEFSFIGLMQILLKGRYDFIYKFYYDEILTEDKETREIFFSEAMSCVWINEKSAGRRYNGDIRFAGERVNKDSILASIAEVSKKDVMDNIKLLEDNRDRLNYQFDSKNITDLWVLTRPNWLLKKNLMLFREFCVSQVRPTAIAQTDLEDKIHLAIELGLLNPPRNRTFRNIESTVPRQREFSINGAKRKIFSTNILNYFQRNTTRIGETSYAEYIYWFYRIQACGKEEFYKIFFSDKKAGQRSTESFNSPEDKRIYGNEKEMSRIINDNFANKFYSSIINNYGEYEEVLKDYSNSSNSSMVSPYFSHDILDEDIVIKLEQCRSRDIFTEENGLESIHTSPYAYVFGETIISRYKVLRNLSILKRKYGYINEDMLLTSIAYKSYFSKNVFDEISESIRKGWAR